MSRAPGVPSLGFLRRRPPRHRTSPELVRTGNLSLDLSPNGVRTDRPGAAPVVPSSASGRVPVLRGRTALSENTPSVRIGGKQASGGALHLTLTWSTVPPDSRSAAAGLSRSTDLHLGCLWEMNDGQSGVIQSLGGGEPAARSHGATVLRLGPRSETEGETLTASLKQIGLLKRMVLFAYAIDGRPQWDALAPRLTADLRGGVTIDLVPGPAPTDATICALASVHRVAGTLVLRREAEYLIGQQASVALAYGWNLPWASGRTVPAVRPR